MPIRYRITQRTNNLGASKETKYIMQAVTTRSVDLDEISYEISQECTLSKVDVMAVIMALGDKLQQHLEEGRSVDLAQLGKFKVGFKGVAHEEAHKLRTKEIQRFYLNYQPSKKIKHWLKKGVKVYKEEKK